MNETKWFHHNWKTKSEYRKNHMSNEKENEEEKNRDEFEFNEKNERDKKLKKWRKKMDKNLFMQMWK